MIKKNKYPFVSIVTPNYNGEKYLEETIRSIVKQTSDDYEFILVDGKSTDNSINIIKKDIEEIISIRVSELKQLLLERNIDLVISEKAKSWIAKNSFDKEYGARPLKRTIESNIKDKLADQLLAGKLKEGNIAFVDEENDSISLKIRDSANTIH